MTKVCNRCGDEKPLTEFYRMSSKPERWRPDCKVCFRRYRAAKPKEYLEADRRRRVAVRNAKKAQEVREQVEANKLDRSPTPFLHGGSHEPIVYFALVGGMVKIGLTTNLSKRLRDLCLRPRHIIGFKRGGRKVEQELHKMFRKLRDGDTEWFTFGKEIQDYLWN